MAYFTCKTVTKGKVSQISFEHEKIEKKRMYFNLKSNKGLYRWPDHS
jgi:hypothetical protein